MNTIDIGLLLGIYIYIIIVLLFSSNKIKNENLARKFTHIMVANLIFVIPFLTSRNVAVFGIAIPFLIVTVLISKISPIEIKNNITSKGHPWGLILYSISWIVLLYFFFDNMIVVAIGMAALGYGDGFASLIGQKWGGHKYNLTGDEKSIEGSVSMFISAFIMFIIATLFYEYLGMPTYGLNLLLLAIIALVATFLEAITPNGFDNISTSIISAFLYYTLGGIL